MHDALAALPPLLAAHVRLTAAALASGALLAFPLGIWATRRPRLLAPFVLLAALVQTVPGIALLAAMVPLLAALGAALGTAGAAVRAIGFLPAYIALTLYSLLPMLRNTIAGIRGVDPAVRDAARGVGMTDGQLLRRVELPLALPTLVAGLRTATVWTVGMATLSTPVGAPSLGNLIFSGLQTRDTAAVLVGCAAAAALALLLDGLVKLLEIGVARPRRVAVAGGAAGLAALLAFALWPAGLLAGGSGRDVATAAPVVLGAKPFSEQLVLAELMAAQVRRRTGAPARVLPALGSTVAWDALRAGTLDAYVDYSGTLWATVLHGGAAAGGGRASSGRASGAAPPKSGDASAPPPMPGRDVMLATLGRELRARWGVEVLGPLGFENTYALAMDGRRAAALGLARLSQLAPLAPRLEVGGDYELFGRPEWRDLRRVYGLRFAAERAMDPSLMYEAIATRQVDLIGAYSTDGRIAALHLRLLEDDRHVIPPYDAVLLVRPRLAAERPAVVAALRELVGTIDAARMQRANLEVDQRHRPPAAVAAELLPRR